MLICGKVFAILEDEKDFILLCHATYSELLLNCSLPSLHAYPHDVF